MVTGLQSTITGAEITTWIIIAFLVGYFIYKEAPEFKKRISKSAVDEKQQAQTEKTLFERLDAIEKKLGELEEKLTKDYDRINAMEKEQKDYLDEEILVIKKGRHLIHKRLVFGKKLMIHILHLSNRT